MLYKNVETVDLIIKSREKDDAAFSELIERYTPMLKNLISGFLDNGSFGYDELFSEACVAFHSAVERFDVEQGSVSFGLYCKICVHNRLVDLIRSAKSSVNIVDLDVEKVSGVADPESVVVRRERFEFLLKEAAGLLSEYEYEVLLLHIQGYKTSMIASMLSKTAKSVDNAKARLFKRLREALGGASAL